MNEPTDDLHQMFDVHRRGPASVSVESDLAAVREQSAGRQRRRIFASTAAAGLLLVGVGALVVTRDTTPADVEVAVADLSGDSDAPIDPRPSDDTDDDDTGDTDDTDDVPVTTDEVNESDADESDADDADDAGADDADDAGADDDSSFPAPPEFEPWPEDVVVGGDEFDDFVAAQLEEFEAWFEAVCEWLDEHCDDETDGCEWLGDIDLNDLDLSDIDLGDVDLGDFDLEDWLADANDWTIDIDDFADVEVVDGAVEVDLDGDGEPDRTITFEIPDFGEFDLGEFGDFGDLGDLDIENFDIELPDFGDLENFDIVFEHAD